MKTSIAALTLLFSLNVNAALINIYESNHQLLNLTQVKDIIDNTGISTTFNNNDIFFSDNGISGPPGFLGGHDTTFVLTASGVVDTSLYSALRFVHDDGIEVHLDGDSLYEFNGNTPPKNSGWLTFDDTGLTSFNLTYWENYGGGTIQVYGKLRNGGAEVLADIDDPLHDVPEPSGIAILGLGLLGLATRKVKKQA